MGIDPFDTCRTLHVGGHGTEVTVVLGQVEVHLHGHLSFAAAVGCERLFNGGNNRRHVDDALDVRLSQNQGIHGSRVLFPGRQPHASRMWHKANEARHRLLAPRVRAGQQLTPTMAIG